jgi:hypothetical protein
LQRHCFVDIRFSVLPFPIINKGWRSLAIFVDNLTSINGNNSSEHVMIKAGPRDRYTLSTYQPWHRKRLLLFGRLYAPRLGYPSTPLLCSLRSVPTGLRHLAALATHSVAFTCTLQAPPPQLSVSKGLHHSTALAWAHQQLFCYIVFFVSLHW